MSGSKFSLRLTLDRTVLVQHHEGRLMKSPHARINTKYLFSLDKVLLSLLTTVSANDGVAGRSKKYQELILP